MSYSILPVRVKLGLIENRKRHGDIVRIAEKLDYSEAHVCNVLKGRYDNKRIVNFAYNMTRGRS
jgi:hypothetical protein